MNMSLFLISGTMVAAYLLGSIPTSVWAGKWFFGVDLREHGSGNAGATNAFRVLGKKTALTVLFIDILKGMAAVALSFFVTDHDAGAEWFKVYQYALGLAALLGHVFPVFAGFKGGKGIATLTGIVIVLFPGAILVCLIVFAIVFAITRYVSLGSMLAAVTFPVIVIFFSGEALIAEIVFALVVAVFVPVTHKKNIKRLLRGTENKISFKKQQDG